MEKVNSNENDYEPKCIHYNPHHPVQITSTSTPICIIYNCGCKENKHSSSLNNYLHSYQPETTDITEILTRFLAEKYAVNTDSEKASTQTDCDVKHAFSG